MSELLGTTLGDRYRLDLVIGQGGNGTIFKAYDTEMDRDVALKLLQSTSESAERMRIRFKTEALAAGRIQHPNVVAIYDVAVKKGSAYVYMVMELLHGWDLLNELHHKGPLDPARALDLFIPCLRGLEKCHQQGVVHKDLKPSNLFIREAGKRGESMCVLDFGVARLLEGERITRAGGVAGTPRYLAPEYIRDASVSPTVDVYQMGLIFIEALTGKPCVPKGEGEFQTFQRHLQGNLELPPGFNSGRFASVIQRAICVDAEVRYPDAGAFANSLEALTPEMIAEALTDPLKRSDIAPEMTTVITNASGSGPHAAPLSLEETSQAHDELPQASEVTNWFSAIKSEAYDDEESESEIDEEEPPVLEIRRTKGPTTTREDASLQKRMARIRGEGGPSTLQLGGIPKPQTPAPVESIDEDDLGAFVLGAAASTPVEETLEEYSSPDVRDLRKSGEFERPKPKPKSEPIEAAPKPSSKKQKKSKKKKKKTFPLVVLFMVFLFLCLVATSVLVYWYYYMS